MISVFFHKYHKQACKLSAFMNTFIKHLSCDLQSSLTYIYYLIPLKWGNSELVMRSRK